MGDLPVCALCGLRIGVYEPMVVIEAQSTRTTSLLREPGLRSENVPLVHSQCAEALAASADAQG
jgi:hypothetical protein